MSDKGSISNIESQLAEYRRKRQQEQQNEAAAAAIVTAEKKQTESRFIAVFQGLADLGSRLTTPLTSYITAILLPDHLVGRKGERLTPVADTDQQLTTAEDHLTASVTADVGTTTTRTDRHRIPRSIMTTCEEKEEFSSDDNQSETSAKDSSPLLNASSKLEASQTPDDDTAKVDHQEIQSSALEMFGRRTKLGWAVLVLKVVLWLVAWKLFILIEFGAVFFLFSGFVFIWHNLRSEPRGTEEVSAYSVFNKDCRQIHGTYSAEQFEREILFRR